MQTLDEIRDEIRAALPLATPLYDAEVDAVMEVFRRVLSTELMGSAEVRELLNLSASGMNMRLNRLVRVGRSPVPEPVCRLSCGYIFFAPDVKAWIEENPGAVRHDSPQEVAS